MAAFMTLSLYWTVLYIAEYSDWIDLLESTWGGGGNSENQERITIRIFGDPTEMHRESPKQNSRMFHPNKLLYVSRNEYTKTINL